MKNRITTRVITIAAGITLLPAVGYGVFQYYNVQNATERQLSEAALSVPTHSAITNNLSIVKYNTLEATMRRPDDIPLYNAMDTIINDYQKHLLALSHMNTSPDGFVSDRALRIVQLFVEDAIDLIDRWHHPLITDGELKSVRDQVFIDSKPFGLQLPMAYYINQLDIAVTTLVYYLNSKFGGVQLHCSFQQTTLYLNPTVGIVGEPMDGVVTLFPSYSYPSCQFYLNNKLLNTSDGVGNVEVTFEREGWHRLPIKAQIVEQRLEGLSIVKDTSYINKDFRVYAFPNGFQFSN